MKRLVLKFLRDEDGFLGGLLAAGKAILGSTAVKGAAKAVGGALLGGVVDRYNAKKDYQQRRELGFTHSEIAQSGGAAAGSSTGAVMGNQQTQFEAMQKQQAFEAEQRALDRQVHLSGQATQLQSAGIAAAASRYSSDVAASTALSGQANQFDIAAMTNDREWQNLANRWANDNPELNLRFKQMSMGFENVRLELVLARNGLNLSNLAKMDQAEFNRRMTSVMSELAALEGLGGIKNEGLREGMAAMNDIANEPNPVLGNPGLGTPPMPTLGRTAPQ